MTIYYDDGMRDATTKCQLNEKDIYAALDLEK